MGNGKRTIGVFAHVDAGKTTYCEALLAHAGAIGRAGRVDNGDAVMDHDGLEQRRGITIFSDVASFDHGGCRYYLVDTPGHVDFSAEMERTLPVLDGAVLLLSATDGVQSHTLTVFRLLREHRVPTCIFINKTDLAGADPDRCMREIRGRLTPDCRLLTDAPDPADTDLLEWLCDYDDTLLQAYLEDRATPVLTAERLPGIVLEKGLVFVHAGSALRMEGVAEAMDTLHAVLPPPPPAREGAFAARVFKVIHDGGGARVTFLKCLGGVLELKDEVTCGEHREKIHEIRDYQGRTYVNLPRAAAGDIVGVTGLSQAPPGAGLGGCGELPPPTLRPALKAAVLKKGAAHDAVMACLRRLEAQDPLLEVSYEPQLQQIDVHVMGGIQLEVLRDLLAERHGLDIDFGPCKVVYRETVAARVMGYGHYEPLRHYAEVHLRLEPNPGGGVEFASEYHTDRLPQSCQNLIRHHLLERTHRGVLTGSPLTDVRFVLTAGAQHIKHTEGGDFREAAWRAVRQGLEKAESVLLEPFYSLLIDVDTGAMGRVLSDITRLHGAFEPPRIEGERVTIHARGPAETFLEYPAELLSFTGGGGAVSMSFLGYFPCHDPERVIAEIGYERERDLEHVSSSVFCAKGAGFEVKWHEAEGYMHLLK